MTYKKVMFWASFLFDDELARRLTFHYREYLCGQPLLGKVLTRQGRVLESNTETILEKSPARGRIIHKTNGSLAMYAIKPCMVTNAVVEILRNRIC